MRRAAAGYIRSEEVYKTNAASLKGDKLQEKFFKYHMNYNLRYSTQMLAVHSFIRRDIDGGGGVIHRKNITLEFQNENTQ